MYSLFCHFEDKYKEADAKRFDEILKAMKQDGNYGAIIISWLGN